MPLAQIFEPPIPSVAPTPWAETWITGSGLPGAAAALGLGVLAWIILSRADKRPHAWAALAAGALLSAAVFITGRAVVTQRETLRLQARAFIDAAATADTPALRNLLHPDARVRTRFGSADSREQIITLAERAAGYIPAHDIREVRADPRGPQVARTQVRLSIEGGDLPRASWWALDWQKPTPDAPWVVTGIEPIWIQGFENPAGNAP